MSVHFKLYSIYYTLYKIQYKQYIMQDIMYILHYALCTECMNSVTQWCKYQEIGLIEHFYILDAQELSKQLPQNIWMSKSWSNNYQNIFECPRDDQTNVQMYADKETATNVNIN